MPVHTAQDTAAACKGIHPWQNRSLLYTKFCCIEPDSSKRVGKTKSAVIEKDKTLRWLIEAVEDRLGAELRRELPEHLVASGRHVMRFRAMLRARMMVNMAGTVIENAGLCLDRHFGMPYIPGSALKGVALRAARAQEADPETVREVFGEQDRGRDARKGAVSFLPAYPTAPAKLELDVMTGHHGEYYKGQEARYRAAPDTESPNPVKFPVVAAGTEFEFVVCGTGLAASEQVRQAAEWLIRGIGEIGVGAKTAAGYGWFHYDAGADRRREAAAEQQRRAEQEAKRKAEDDARRLAAMPPEQRRKAELLALDDGALAGMVKTLEQADDTTKRAYVMLLCVEKQGLWKEWSKAKKGKGVERAALLRKIAACLGEALP